VVVEGRERVGGEREDYSMPMLFRYMMHGLQNYAHHDSRERRSRRIDRRFLDKRSVCGPVVLHTLIIYNTFHKKCLWLLKSIGR
jgi:hypothetical protein